jgi:hypothetical protein
MVRINVFIPLVAAKTWLKLIQCHFASRKDGPKDPLLRSQKSARTLFYVYEEAPCDGIQENGSRRKNDSKFRKLRNRCNVCSRFLISRYSALELMYNGEANLDIGNLEDLLFVFARFAMPSFTNHFAKSMDHRTSLIFFKNAFKGEKFSQAIASFEQFPSSWMLDSTFLK